MATTSDAGLRPLQGRIKPFRGIRRDDTACGRGCSAACYRAAQRWLTQSIALQGTALAGAGYAAVGTIHGLGVGDYHYGVAPQALLAMRLIFGERAALDVTAREYFVSRIGSGGAGGNDNIARADISFTVRVHKQHSIAVKYLWNRRDASYSFLGDSTQERATVGIFYSYIGHDHFGAVDWR